MPVDGGKQTRLIWPRPGAIDNRISNPTNSGPCVGKVPLVTGTFLFAARLPAAARIGMINRLRNVETIIPPKTVVPTEWRPAEPAPRVAPPPPPNPAKPIDLGEIDRYLAGLAKPT